MVSSSLLSKVAAAAGVSWVETLTGFKWLSRAADAVPGGRLLFAYEEALGYSVGASVRDKDGIGAALAVLSLVAADLAAGRPPLLGRLDDLEARHGVHRTCQVSRRLRTAEAAGAAMAALRAAPPSQLGGDPVTAVEDLAVGARLPPTDGIILRTAGARVVVRPSGTEPKLKAYIEVVVVAADGKLGAARRRATNSADRLVGALHPLLDGGRR